MKNVSKNVFKKKLVLNKETISTPRMDEVKGGIYPSMVFLQCVPPTQFRCTLHLDCTLGAGCV